ncbi:NAD-P-binding protein [Athelia psychrophila]|uniref:NAD-P-binding protein n=1 Tax=Athelia psychrophila TaxID=1759441 RepID=A0A166X5Q4_9AGAM|nr:NAD-P-binding protein [Fibularhizoctonia sp. CBS 109695]
MFLRLYRHLPSLARPLPLPTLHYHRTMSSVTLIEKQKLFLSSPQFAVVGASADKTKFGTKVLQWYQAHSKTVTPVHPKNDELEGIPAVRTLANLSAPAETSVSIITNPKITLGLLQQAKDLAIPALWLQPGAEDAAVIAYINANGLGDKVIYGGPCILVDGDRVVQSLL